MEYTQFSLIGLIRIYFWDQAKSKSIDHYLLRIRAIIDISVNEQLTLDRYSFRHLVFLVLEIRVAPTINWYLFHVHLLVFSHQLFPRKMDKNRYLYELLVKRQSESAKTCWLHRSLNFFIKPFFKIKRFWQIKQNKICNSARTYIVK